jgi:Fic family protein
MTSGETTYIWQLSDWPDWRYDLTALAGPLAQVSHAQGRLSGRLADVGLALQDQASLMALTHDVLKTSEIEGSTSMSTRCVRRSRGAWGWTSARWHRPIAGSMAWSR